MQKCINRFITIILIIGIAILLIAGIAITPSFAEEEQVQASAAKHTYSKEWQMDYQEHWHECLDDPDEDPADLEYHQFGEDGEARYKCSVCGYVRKAHQHKYQTKWSFNAWEHWHECQNTDWEDDFMLDKCDNKWLDSESHKYTPGDCGCKCAVCGYTEKHVYCDGKKICYRCGYEIPEDHEHDWTHVTKEVISSASCDEAGEVELTCVCGETKREKIPATGHNFSGLATTCRNGCGKKNPDIITSTPFTAKVAATSSKVTCSWNKVSGANSYRVYMATKKGKFKYIATTKSSSYAKKKLKSKTGYKFYVKAYKGSKYMSKTPVVYTITNGSKYVNASKVSAQTTISLNVGNKTSVKATVSKSSSKKTLYTGGCTKLRYYTNSSKIATVNSKGEVTAKKVGMCNIYSVAPNGVVAKTTITIKQ